VDNTQEKTRGSRFRSLRRWLLRGFLGLLAFLVLAAVAGAVYQAIELRADRAAFPPPGRMVDIGNHRLHLWCQGSGAPVVMLDAGAGIWSIGWQSLQDELSKRTTACAFDRSGLGWSEAGPGALDGVSAARELHALVERAGLPRPFVYVGHSLGADFGQVYYGAYPDDLAGLVLIDPGLPEDLLEDFHGDRAAALGLSGCGYKCLVARLATDLGVTRLATHLIKATLMSPTFKARYRSGLAQPAAAATIVGYLELLPKTAYQVLAVTDYRDLPFTVIYTEKTRKPEGKETEHDVEVWHAHVLDKMRELVALSTRGRGPVIVNGATHSSILTPQYVLIVAGEIERLVETKREPASEPAGRL
jgi:pimeloyl-ACP methyl ester carboxylesterase